MKKTREQIKLEIEQTQKRLDAYLDQEAMMLSNGGVKRYKIGTRELERYELSLKSVQDMIQKLQTRIEDLESKLNGGGNRRAVGIVPRDW
jgi:hypothetical protein